MSETRISLEMDPVARVTFSTEGGLNILSTAVLNRLDEVVRELGDSSKGSSRVRVCIFAGEGKVFFAGADIKEMSAYDTEGARVYGRLGMDVFDAVAALPCVTIAAINGAALGGGLELALACDLRIAVRTAKLGLPEVTLGLVPGWKGMTRLPALVGPSRARRLVLSGEAIKAEDALAMGLVDELVNSTEDLEHRVQAVARSFFGAGPQAVALAKRALSDGDDLLAFTECFLEGADGQAGMAAFLQKSKPPWARM